MSWYKRTPKVKEPVKHLYPHRTSPTTERILEETKAVHLSEKKKQPKKH